MKPSTEQILGVHQYYFFFVIPFYLKSVPEKKVASLERGPLSLVSTTEELLGIKVTAPV
jgi:hypothetical protein